MAVVTAALWSPPVDPAEPASSWTWSKPGAKPLAPGDPKTQALRTSSGTLSLNPNTCHWNSSHWGVLTRSRVVTTRVSREDPKDLVSVEDKGDGILIFHFGDGEEDANGGPIPREVRPSSRLPSAFKKKSPIVKSVRNRKRNAGPAETESPSPTTSGDSSSNEEETVNQGNPPIVAPSKPRRPATNFSKRSPIPTKISPLSAKGRDSLSVNAATGVGSVPPSAKPYRPPSTFLKRSPISKKSSILPSQKKANALESGLVSNTQAQVSPTRRPVTSFVKRSPIPQKTQIRYHSSVKPGQSAPSDELELGSIETSTKATTPPSTKKATPKNPRKSRKSSVSKASTAPQSSDSETETHLEEVLDSTIDAKPSALKAEKKTSRASKSKQEKKLKANEPEELVFKGYEAKPGDVQREPDASDDGENETTVKDEDSSPNKAENQTLHPSSDKEVIVPEETKPVESKRKLRNRRKKTDDGNSPSALENDSSQSNSEIVTPQSGSTDPNHSPPEILASPFISGEQPSIQNATSRELESSDINHGEVINTVESDEAEEDDDTALKTLLELKKLTKGPVKEKISLDLDKFNPTEPPPQDWDLSLLSLAELKDIARTNGLKGYSKMKKAEIIELIRVNGKSRYR